MSTLVYKNIPKFQSDMWDEYYDYMGNERLLRARKILKGTRHTASTAIDYKNKMNCYLHFDNGFSASAVEIILTLPHTTVKRYHDCYLIDNS